MEKAVESVFLWLDETQNNCVKEPNSSPCAQAFIFVSSEIMGVGKRIQS